MDTLEEMVRRDIENVSDPASRNWKSLVKEFWSERGIVNE